MSELPDKASLKDYQKLIKQLVIDRGFDKETVPELYMMLLEEAGEFAKAARKLSSVKVDPESEVFKLEEEAADVFWILIDLCNRQGIDLEKAFLAKEAKNRTRNWS